MVPEQPGPKAPRSLARSGCRVGPIGSCPRFYRLRNLSTAEKGKPVARRGRKAMDLHAEAARLPALTQERVRVRYSAPTSRDAETVAQGLGVERKYEGRKKRICAVHAA